jgi:hypothetical protein
MREGLPDHEMPDYTGLASCGGASRMKRRESFPTSFPTIAENGRADGPYGGRIATAKVALAELSCRPQRDVRRGRFTAVVTDWLDWRLKGRNELARTFTGPSCDFCSAPNRLQLPSPFTIHTGAAAMTHTRRLLASLALGFAIAAASAYAQSFDLRVGQWDFTMSGITGSLGDLSKLPPQARAQVEAQMRKGMNYKSCLTAQDLKDLNIGKPDEDDDEACTVTSRKVTVKTADITRQCTGERKRTETMHFEAASRESLKATINTVSAVGPATVTVTGKWIGATCTEDD